MAHLIVAEQGKLKKFEITEDFVFIGRTPENQIKISDEHASRQHCQIIKTGKGYRLIDLGSEHGTLVKGQKVKQKDLAEGDIFQIGAVKIAIKEIGGGAAAAPRAPAAKRSPAAAGRPGAAAGRGPSRRRQQQEDKKITISKDMARASARGGHLVRKNVRKGSKMPGWVQAVIAFWVVVIVVVVVVYMIKHSSSPHGETYSQALELWQKDHRLEEAFNLFETIPVEDPEYGEQSRERMKEIKAEREAGNVQHDALNASRNYENNILLFIHKYIDAPPEKPKWALKIKRDYAADRKSYVRILLKNRINPFIERFTDSPHLAHVKELQRKYAKEVNVDSRAEFRDVEVEADCALNLSGYGEAYQVMSQWMAANPSSNMRERAGWVYKTIWNRLDQEWKNVEPQIIRNEESNKPKYAIKKLDRMLRLTEGYDAPEGKKFRAELERRRAANQAKVDAVTGGGSE